MMSRNAMSIVIYTGSLIVLFSLLGTALRLNARTIELKKFIRLLYVFIAGNLCCLVFTFFYGHTWPLTRFVMLLMRTLAFVFLAYGIPLFFSYLCRARKSDFRRFSIRLMIMYAVYVLSVAMLVNTVANLFTGYLFSISPECRIEFGPLAAANECIVIVQMALMMILAATDPNSRLRKYYLWPICLLPLCAAAATLVDHKAAYIWPFSALSLLLVYVNVLLENEHIIRQNEIELRQNRLSFLLGQIQPHFVFNVLNTIYYLCDTDSQKALEATRDFRLFLENQVQNTDAKETVPFEQELEYVTHYTDLEKLRFDQIEIVHDIETSDFQIPPLTVQPLVENAIRHGLKETEGGYVRISVRKSAEGYIVEVRDNGIGYVLGLKNDGRHHVGIENVRNRLSIISGAKLSIEALKPHGTCARITIPYTEKGYQREE